MVDIISDALTRAVNSEYGDEYYTYCSIAWDALDSAHQEVLIQLLFQGPVADGNIVSKTARDELIEYGLATRCCFMGEDGYTAATYMAHSLFTHGGGVPIKKKPGSPA